MQLTKFLILSCFFLFQKSVYGTTFFTEIASTNIKDSSRVETVQLSSAELSSFQRERPNPLLKLFRTKHKNNKKIMAAILAFPLPFGIVGLHRIYLGTAPYVPVVYIASLGGIFGLLPLIDFFVILKDKSTLEYTGNKKVFMWVD